MSFSLMLTSLAEVLFCDAQSGMKLGHSSAPGFRTTLVQPVKNFPEYQF